ncbi:hypothetical protein [Methanosarcina sp.]|uniref:hypothetical protein n=1 Tax=Methanosarcina sp. TaxID=2213 RepID=UPI003BB5823E
MFPESASEGAASIFQSDIARNRKSIQIRRPQLHIEEKAFEEDIIKAGNISMHGRI